MPAPREGAVVIDLVVSPPPDEDVTCAACGAILPTSRAYRLRATVRGDAFALARATERLPVAAFDVAWAEVAEDAYGLTIEGYACRADHVERAADVLHAALDP